MHRYAFMHLQDVAGSQHSAKEACNILKSLPFVTPVFNTLQHSSTPTCVQVEERLYAIERFVVRIYDRSSECEITNQARR